MLKSRKLKRNRYQESLRDRFKVRFHHFNGFFVFFAWFCFILVLGAGLSRLYYEILDAHWFKLEQIDIAGIKALDRTQVLDAMGLIRGESTLGISAPRVAERLEKLPLVESASVRVDYGGRIAVSIVERRPVAVLRCGEQNMLMDSKGLIFAKVNPGQKNPFPLITGLCGADVKTGDRVGADSLQHINELLSAVEDSKWLSTSAIDECRWAGDGFTIILGKRAIPVHFGKEDFASKLTKLKNVLSTLNDRGWTDLVTRIDLDYPDRAYLEGQFPVAAPVEETAKRPG